MMPMAVPATTCGHSITEAMHLSRIHVRSPAMTGYAGRVRLRMPGTHAHGRSSDLQHRVAARDPAVDDHRYVRPSVPVSTGC